MHHLIHHILWMDLCGWFKTGLYGGVQKKNTFCCKDASAFVWIFLVQIAGAHACVLNSRVGGETERYSYI
jgi:hypothetical protein